MSDHVKQKQEKLSAMDAMIVKLQEKEINLTKRISLLTQECQNCETRVKNYEQQEQKSKQLQVQVEHNEKLLREQQTQINDFEQMKEKYEKRAKLLDISEQLISSVRYLVGEFATVYEGAQDVVNELEDVSKKRKEIDTLLVSSSSPDNNKRRGSSHSSEDRKSEFASLPWVEKTVTALFALPERKVFGASALYAEFQKESDIGGKTCFMKNINHHFEHTPRQIFEIGTERLLFRKESLASPNKQNVFYLQTI